MTVFIQQIEMCHGGFEHFGTETFGTSAEAWDDLKDFIRSWQEDNPDDQGAYELSDFAVAPCDVAWVGKWYKEHATGRSWDVSGMQTPEDGHTVYTLFDLHTGDSVTVDGYVLARDYTPADDKPSTVYPEGAKNE